LDLLFLHKNYTLAHPFFEMLHDSMEEPTTEPVFDENEGEKHTVANWKCK
jgi:hypothetical protein